MKVKKGNIFITMGLLLIAVALLITVFNFVQNNMALKASDEALARLRAEMVVAKENSLNELTADEEPLYKTYEDMTMPDIIINGEEYIGVLSVPSLSLELPIKGEFSYDALKTAPCRYDGSVYKNNMIIAGHNYPAHFSGLKALKIGDRVAFTDGDGNQFLYSVSDIVQIDGMDVDGMKAGDWDMTLFTCNLSGKARVTIRLEALDK